MMKKVLLPALAASVLLVAGVYGCRYLNWETKRSPEELMQVALNGETAEERELAAAELTEYGEEAKQNMRDVLAQSNDPNVKAICIHGLGLIYDYESIDIMLAGLEDESPVIRGRSAIAVRKLIGRSFHFDPAMSETERRQRVDAIRKEWESIRDSGLIDQFRERMQRKEQANS